MSERDRSRLYAEKELNSLSTILTAIKNLREGDGYIMFKRHVLDPSIENVRKRLKENEKQMRENPSKVNPQSIVQEIMRDLGMLKAFEAFSDLDALEKEYKVAQENMREYLKKHA